MPTAPPEVVDRIAAICRERGIGPRQLARQAGISLGGAQRILEGRGVGQDIVDRAARSLGFQIVVRYTLTKL